MPFFFLFAYPNMQLLFEKILHKLREGSNGLVGGNVGRQTKAVEEKKTGHLVNEWMSHRGQMAMVRTETVIPKHLM